MTAALVIHDYSGRIRDMGVIPKRTVDPLRRRQVIHFDGSMRPGHVLVIGSDPFQARCWLVKASILHPEGIAGVYWATIVPVAFPVTVLGQTYPARTFADRV